MCWRCFFHGHQPHTNGHLPQNTPVYFSQIKLATMRLTHFAYVFLSPFSVMSLLDFSSSHSLTSKSRCICYATIFTIFFAKCDFCRLLSVYLDSLCLDMKLVLNRIYLCELICETLHPFRSGTCHILLMCSSFLLSWPCMRINLPNPIILNVINGALKCQINV